MSKLLTLNIPGPIVQGDTWPGLEITILKDSKPVDLRGATVKLQLFQGMQKTLDISTENESIELVEAEDGILYLKEIVDLELVGGRHVGHLEVTDAAGVRTTYCRVVMDVINDLTK